MHKWSNNAPLNFDLSLRKSDCVLSEQNVLGSWSSILHTFSDSCIASAQCFKRAKKQK